MSRRVRVDQRYGDWVGEQLDVFEPRIIMQVVYFDDEPDKQTLVHDTEISEWFNNESECP